MAEKITKAEAEYTPRAAHHDERCALCQHFRASNGTCSEVISGPGGISPGGWCKRFAPR